MRLDITKLVLMSALFIGTTTACGKDDDGDTDPSGSEVCDDSEDNDGDGDVDCEDSDCASDADCAVPDEELDCDDGEDDDEDGDVDCDDSDCASDRDCEPEFFEPFYFTVEGGFGYDAATGEVVTAIADGNPLAPYVVYSFYEEEYTEDYDDTYQCDIIFYYEGGTPLPLEIFTDDEGVTNGGFKADLADTTAWVAETNCLESEGKQLDPDIVPDSDGVAWITAGLTELGVGVGEASEQLQGDIDQYITTDPEYYGGGGFWMASAEGGAYNSLNATFGYAVDEDMNLLVDGDANVLLLASDYADGSGVPAHGYYRSISFYIFGLQ